jgi:hypothetical protein
MDGMNKKHSLTDQAALLENLPRTPDHKARRNAAARDVAEALLAFCKAEGLDLIGERACPLCGFLDESWYCWHCDRPIPKSQMSIASADSPQGHQHKASAPFIGFCPHCPPGCTELPEPTPEGEA